MGAPFGDYVLKSYCVACDGAEIVLRAERPFEGEPRVTEIVFSGVVAYDFRYDTLSTIFGHVVEHALDEFVRAHATQFEEGARLCGWAPFWTGDVNETVRRLEADGRHAFGISSSYGLVGWVIASSFHTRTV